MKTFRWTMLWAGLGLLACNDAKPVDPQAPSPNPPSQPDESQPHNKTPMPTERAPQTHLPGLTDASFFDGTTSKSMADARDELADAGTAALRLDGPFAVDTDTQSEFPVIGLFARETTDAGAFENSSIVVAVDLSHGGFHADTALRSSKFAGDAAGAGADQDAAFVVSAFDLDVFERLEELPQRGSTHRIYIVEGGHLSNGVTTTLSGDPPSAPAMRPPTVVVNTKADSDSPAAPAAGGVTLSIPSSAVSEPGGSAMLRGSVRGTGDSTEVFLIATGDAASGPFSFTVEVPLRDGVGHFNLDIVADEGPPKQPGQWHWYAFSGRQSAGPASVRLEPGKPW